MSKVLEVKNLTKVIGKKKILDDITFDLEEGKILGIIGRNGAGKSMLLKTIVGLCHFTNGTIKLNGYDISKEYENAIRSVWCVIEVPAMYENLSGKENLEIFRMMFKNVSDKKIHEIIKLVSLEDSQYKKLKIYSLGMRQKLGIAVALINNPKLLILDEPTSSLDSIDILDLKKFLKSLKKTSVIISSNMLNQIESVCDEVIFMNEGKIINRKEISKIKKCKFSVDDGEKAKKILSNCNFNTELEVSKDEVSIINKILVKNNVKVFKISEDTCNYNLEKEFLSLLEDECE